MLYSIPGVLRCLIFESVNEEFEGNAYEWEGAQCNFKWHMNNVVKGAFSLRLKQTRL